MASCAILLGGEVAVTAMRGALAGGGSEERRRMMKAGAGGSAECLIGCSPLSGHPETRLAWSPDVCSTSAGREHLFAAIPGTLQSAGALVAAAAAAAGGTAGSLGKRDACFARRRRRRPVERAPPDSAFCQGRLGSADRDGGGAATASSISAASWGSRKTLNDRSFNGFLESRCSACLLPGRGTSAISRKGRATGSRRDRLILKPAALAPIDHGPRLAIIRTSRGMGGVQEDDMVISASGQFGEGLVRNRPGRISWSQKGTPGGAGAGAGAGAAVVRPGGLSVSFSRVFQRLCRFAQCRVSSSDTRGRAGRYSEQEEEEEEDGDEEEDDNEEEEEEEEVIVGRREAYVDDADFDLDFGDDVMGERGEGGEEGGANDGGQSSMTLRELLEEASVRPMYVAGNAAELVVTGISVDSRTTRAGDVFVCIVGEKTDGHLYVAEAVEKGAVAVVASKEEEVLGVCDGEKGVKALVIVEDTSAVISPLSSAVYRHPSRQMAVIGVTGTNGKTTTSYLLRGMYNAMGLETGLIGTIHHFVGQKKLESSQTTPEAAPLHRLMMDMVDAGVSACVMETSSHGLELGRVDDVDFDVAVFTNFTRDHLDFHTTEENYRNAKGKLFDRMIDPDRHRKVINLDDPNADWFMARGNPDVPVVTFGMEREDADVRALEVQLSLFETEVVVRTPKGDLEISSGLLGRHNVYNILAAVAVGIAIDAPLEEVVKGIEEVDAVPGRCELIDEEQAFAVVVDYAHTPDALGRLLDSVRECGPRRLITVIGCGGDRDRGKRPLMAKIATEKSEVTILTSDNPRTETPLDIIDDMLAGVGWSIEDYLKWGKDGFYPPLPNGHRLFVHDMRIIAVRAAVAMGEEGDAVVIAGKGHETYQIIGTATDYFDDREECREALQHVDALHAAGIDTSEFPWRFVDQ